MLKPKITLKWIDQWVELVPGFFYYYQICCYFQKVPSFESFVTSNHQFIVIILLIYFALYWFLSD